MERTAPPQHAAVLSHAQRHNGPIPHDRHENVADPSPERGRETRQLPLMMKKAGFCSITNLLAETQLAEPDCSVVSTSVEEVKTRMASNADASVLQSRRAKLDTKDPSLMSPVLQKENRK